MAIKREGGGKVLTDSIEKAMKFLKGRRNLEGAGDMAEPGGVGKFREGQARRTKGSGTLADDAMSTEEKTNLAEKSSRGKAAAYRKTLDDDSPKALQYDYDGLTKPAQRAERMNPDSKYSSLFRKNPKMKEVDTSPSYDKATSADEKAETYGLTKRDEDGMRYKKGGPIGVGAAKRGFGAVRSK